MSSTLQMPPIRLSTSAFFFAACSEYAVPAYSQPPQSFAYLQLLRFLSGVFPLFIAAYRLLALCLTQLSTTCLSRIEVVTEPTPPGTGVIASTIGATPS